jgi:DNA (cytosine-5)-methyltransferase 1
MATVIHTGSDRDMAANYLAAALKSHKQAEIARHLGVHARTVRRWPTALSL